MTLQALRLFVIIGILSSVHQVTLGQNKGRVPAHLRFLGFINTTIEEVERFDEEMCTKNGGPGAYDAHKKSWELWSSCVHSVKTEIKNEAISEVYPSRRPSLNILYDKFCYRISNFEDCFKNITDSMKTCLDPEKHESANIIYNTVSSVLQFLCAEGTPRLTETSLGVAEMCFMTQNAVLLNCANQTITKYIRTNVPNGVQVGGLGALHLLVPDSEKCKVLEQFQLCTVETFKDCLPPTVAEFEKSVFNIVKKVTSCDRWLKSRASQTQGVNIFLIPVAMGMYLRLSYK